RLRHRRRRPRARRRVRAGASRDDRDRDRAPRPALACRDRGRGRYRERMSSVLDHRFGSGDPYTLGVEEEYMLLDPETWDLVQHIDSMLARVTDEGEFEARINPELMQSVLEITTPVCHTAGEVADHLRSEEHTSELQSLRHLVC